MLPLQPRGLRAVTPGRSTTPGDYEWGRSGAHERIPVALNGCDDAHRSHRNSRKIGFLPPLLSANIVMVLAVVGSKSVAGGAQPAGAIPPGRPDRAGVAARRERPG